MEQAPPSVKKVEKAMEAMIGDIQKQHLLPKQKEAFLCCAKCCDSSDDLQQLQGWWVPSRHAISPCNLATQSCHAPAPCCILHYCSPTMHAAAPTMHSCSVERCSQTSAQSQKMIQNVMHEFQVRDSGSSNLGRLN